MTEKYTVYNRKCCHLSPTDNKVVFTIVETDRRLDSVICNRSENCKFAHDDTLYFPAEDICSQFIKQRHL